MSSEGGMTEMSIKNVLLTEALKDYMKKRGKCNIAIKTYTTEC
jgi:hypothetical protein